MGRKRKYFTEEERRLAKRLCENKWKETHIERKKEIEKRYRETHKKEIKEKYNNRSEERKVNDNARTRERYKNCSEEQKERNKARDKIKRETRSEEEKTCIKARGKAYHYNRLKTDINYKLTCYLRCRLNTTLKGNYKSGSAVKDLGCSIPELKNYLESKFKPGMSWKNWGVHGWHIDHIVPLASFDISDREEVLKACHYTNLQPLWAKENLKKGYSPY